MKNIIYLFLVALSMFACKIDNFEAPNATLFGKVVDEVTAETIENGGVNGGALIQLFENDAPQPISSVCLPSGHFTNAALFTGNYKVRALGAFKMIREDLEISIGKSTELDIKVLPNVRLKASLLGNDGAVATVKVAYEKVHQDQTLNRLAVVWSTVDNPNMFTIPNGGVKTVNIAPGDPNTGEMTFTIEGLSPGRRYYIRAAGLTSAPGGYYNYSTTIRTQ